MEHTHKIIKVLKNGTSCSTMLKCMIQKNADEIIAKTIVDPDPTALGQQYLPTDCSKYL